MGTRDIVFQEEAASTAIPGIKKLIVGHTDEVGILDLKYNVNFMFYQTIWDMGIIKIYTGRQGGQLACYAVYLIDAHPHLGNAKVAKQDTIYCRKSSRGIGLKFMKWCDEQLKNEGIKFIFNAATVKKDFGNILMRMGYKKIETIYMREL